VSRAREILVDAGAQAGIRGYNVGMLWMVACSDAVEVSGKVLDTWGNPVRDATVVIEGIVERHHGDSAGKFVIETERTDLSRVAAGKQGYIKEILPLSRVADGEGWQPLTFHLYPDPPRPGFYGIGSTAYVVADARPVRLLATDTESYAGIEDAPEAVLPVGKLEFVYSTPLRRSELAQLNLRLSRLRFVEAGTMKGPLGRQAVAVNLWVAADDVPFDLEALPTHDDYLVRTRDALEEGTYAFHAHNLLAEKDETRLRMLPREQQAAWVFEVR
jgi:hypothetical protein